MAETMHDTFARWLADDATVIGIFENRALDAAGVGDRIALPFERGPFLRTALIGSTPAPDTSRGPGWKYLLVGIATTPNDAVTGMQGGAVPSPATAYAAYVAGFPRHDPRD